MNSIAFRASAAPQFSGSTVAVSERSGFDRALTGMHGLEEALRNGDPGYITAAGERALNAATTPAEHRQIVTAIDRAYLAREDGELKGRDLDTRELNQTGYLRVTEDLRKQALEGALA